MHYVITGSLGHIGKPLVTQLCKEGHSVTVISSHVETTKQIEALGAKAAIGTVEDVQFLTETFRGADAVFTMIPPQYEGNDWKAWIVSIGNNYISAIKASGVKQVVNLSSIGAHLVDKCGPVSALAKVELAMDAMSGVNVRHLRPGYFYTNFLDSVQEIKQKGVMSGNYGPDVKMVLVHPADIAEHAAKALKDKYHIGRGFSYIASDEKTPAEIVELIGKAMNKPDLAWVERTDSEELDEMLAVGVPEETAKNYVEMGAALRLGHMSADYFRNRPVMAGWRTFESFLPELVAAAKG
ncbi:NmrA family protein [Chlorobaculum parvum NCIB 8327]|uniref:NmrA family protein n=1 Tax=Chlorobaculum parvum (strain DSM 263 / NCIMB 8327) TaxID=517417 RepID=B3QNG3_CHLP8|nr:NmrA family NAD(P)-binding protein [Chlorobaculum parvum]ACF11466.1 NmrA family protein [Chlorobaculum parvum NCIB 8327]